MASSIDATKPVSGSPTTQSVRDNFAAAKSEIEALQAAQTRVKTFSVSGTLPIGTSVVGKARWYPESNITVTKVYFSMGVPPTVGLVAGTLLKNGADFSGSNPFTGANVYKSNDVVPPSPTATPSDYFTVNALTTAGTCKDFTMFIEYTKT